MIKILVLSGEIASGKSTFAREFLAEREALGEKWVNICRDDIRLTLDHKDEKLVKSIRNKMVAEAIGNSQNIILSDTNFMNKNMEYALELQSTIRTPIEVELKQFFTPLKDCIERDAARENPVGKKAIMRMWNFYFKKIYEQEASKGYYKPANNLPSCAISDIDGTVALMTNRKPFEWHRVGEDLVNKPVMEILELSHANHDIIFFSGRDEVCRKETEEWLNKNFKYSYKLYMRPEGDNRKDAIIKRELFDKHIRDKYNVRLVLDDRDVCISLWRSLGLPTFQVNYGDF
jgi:predicted kinase